MGTGSSRNQVTIETLPKPAPPAVNSSDGVIARERLRPVRQSTIEKSVTETGAEVEKLCKDPDDSVEVTSVHDDALEDVHDLEQTFDSLGIPASSSLSSDEVNNKVTNRHSQESDLAPLKTKWSGIDVSFPASQNPPERDGGAEDTATAIGWSGIRSTSGPQTRLDIPPTALVNNNNNYNTKSAPTKLTWSLPEPTIPPDEWIYRKSIIDGFDPDKFRKANMKDASGDENKPAVSLPENIIMLHSNSVPDYDLTEQQILDSIEKEFVS